MTMHRYQTDTDLNIYIHGNCQAPALSALISETMGENVLVTSNQVYSIDTETEKDNFTKTIKNADIIFTQPVSENYRDVEWLSSSWIRENCRQDATIITFPVIYHRGQLPQCFPLSRFHGGKLAYHDVHAIDYFLRGRTTVDFIADTSRSDFLSKEFVEAETWRSTLELMRRESQALVDIQASDIIALALGSDQPLLTVNHPARSILAAVANRLLSKVGFSEQVSPTGQPVLDEIIMPPYLSTALALDHSGAGLHLDEVRTGNNWSPRETFYSDVFDQYARIGKPALEAAIAEHPEIGAYLKRYEASNRPSASLADERSLVEAMYRAFFDRGASSAEVLHHLRTIRAAGYDALATSFASTLFLVPGAIDALKLRMPLNT